MFSIIIRGYLAYSPVETTSGMLGVSFNHCRKFLQRHAMYVHAYTCTRVIQARYFLWWLTLPRSIIDPHALEYMYSMTIQSQLPRFSLLHTASPPAQSHPFTLTTIPWPPGLLYYSANGLLNCSTLLLAKSIMLYFIVGSRVHFTGGPYVIGTLNPIRRKTHPWHRLANFPLLARCLPPFGETEDTPWR